MAAKRGIGFVAPSGAIADDGSLARAVDYFAARGWRVVAPALLKARHTRFAGTDATRAAALAAMAARRDIDVVMAVRGGYGASRLLAGLDYRRLAASGKLWVGHSDFTALLCAGFALGGMRACAGPTAAFDFGAAEVSEFTERHFWNVVEEGADEVAVVGDAPRGLSVDGRLWGGNLAMIAHLVGTRFLPKLAGGILFVEDVGEHPYRIERMFHQLAYAGVLARQRAILLGNFSGYRLGANDGGFDLDAVIGQLRRLSQAPVLTGLPFGHVRDKLTLPFGARARVESARGGWRLSYRVAARKPAT